MHAVAPLIDESSGESQLTVEYPGNGVVRFNAATRVAIKRNNQAVTWATGYFISLIRIRKKYESNFKEISKLHLLVVIYECTSLQRKHSCTQKCIRKIWRISSRALAVRQRSLRRFLCAYMLPIRDLCTAFCILLSLFFRHKKLTMSHFARCDVYAAVFAIDVATALCQINR